MPVNVPYVLHCSSITAVFKHDIKSASRILQYLCSCSNTCSNITTATFVSINSKLISASNI